VAVQAVRLCFGEQELAPRIQRVARVELADRARVVLGTVELEPALVVCARVLAHRRGRRRVRARRRSRERRYQCDDEIRTPGTPAPELCRPFPSPPRLRGGEGQG